MFTYLCFHTAKTMTFLNSCKFSEQVLKFIPKQNANNRITRKTGNSK